MDAIPLKAAARDTFGKGPARKLRATGAIPGLIYRAGQTPTHIAIDPKELRLLFQRAGGDMNSIINVQVNDSQHFCLLRQTQKHPVSRELLHADFYEITEGDTVVVEIGINPVGKAKGEVVGGQLRVLRRSIRVRCLPKDIPGRITVDISGMDVNDILRLSDMTLPAGCTAVAEGDINIFSMVGRRADADDADGGEGDEAAEETD